MLNYHQLLYLKEEYVHYRLLYVQLGHHEFVFRSLTRKEYQRILESVSTNEEMEELVCQTALIYPDSWVFAQSPLAGIPKEMSPIIIEASSFLSLDLIFEVFEYEQVRIRQFEEDCMNLVKAAMPEYTFEELEDWTWDRLMKMVARAERLFELRGDDNIKLIRHDQEVQDTIDEQTPDNKAFCLTLREGGIDPMVYFNCQPIKANVVDFPLIGGIHWQEDEVIHELQRQMAT